MHDRLHVLSGVRNFRDFGGYDTEDGRRVKRGMLFRSAHFAEATDEDLDAIRKLGVSLVVDLRGPEERRRFPSKWDEAAQVKAHDVDGPDAWHEFIKQGALDYSKARKYMMDAYTNIPFEDGHRYVYRAAFEGLLNEPGGVLVHCMAGKDRTGILCALIHHALGVPDDHKRADFLFTNHASDVEGRLDWFAEILGEYGGGPPVDREAARALFGVEADYLDHAFGQMGERFGSVDNYLSDFLLIGEPEKAALRAKFVE